MKRSKKGFTLIELVVVIAVLAVLAAIAIPVVSNVVGQARTATDDANIKAVESAIKLYAVQQASTTIDAAGTKTALDAAKIGDIKTQATAANVFIVHADLTVTIAAPGTATLVTGYTDIYFA